MKTSFILRELVVPQQKHMETSSKRVHRSALVKKRMEARSRSWGSYGSTFVFSDNILGITKANLSLKS